jgi:hypothetical protein
LVPHLSLALVIVQQVLFPQSLVPSYRKREGLSPFGTMALNAFADVV